VTAPGEETRDEKQLQPGRVVRVFNLLCLVAGVVLLAVTVQRVGLSRLVELGRQIGGWIAPLLLVHAGIIFCDATAQHFYLRPAQRTISFLRMLGVQAAGNAINLLTPGQKVGEGAKVTLLLGKAPRPRVIAMVLRWNLVSLAISMVASVVGAAVAATLFDLPSAFQHFLVAAVAVAVVVAVGLVLLVRRGLLESFVAAGRFLHIVSDERRRRWADKLAEIDKLLRDGHAGHGLLMGAVFQTGARVLYWFELYVILVAMGDEPGLRFMVAVSGLLVVLNTVASIVPMGIGLTETGLFGLFALLGSSSELGLAASLARRANTLTVSTVGLLVLLGMQTYDRLTLRRSLARLRERKDADAD
jgi:uncharacterized protein (TIRG00374 family)